MHTSSVLIAVLASTAIAAPPVLEPRVDCSSKACKTLLGEGACLISAKNNILAILSCLADAGGVDSVSTPALSLLVRRYVVT